MLVFTLGEVGYVDRSRMLWSLAFQLLFDQFLKTRLVIHVRINEKKNNSYVRHIKEIFIPAPFPFSALDCPLVQAAFVVVVLVRLYISHCLQLTTTTTTTT